MELVEEQKPVKHSYKQPQAKKEPESDEDGGERSSTYQEKTSLFEPVSPRAYRAAEGGERACNARSPHVESEIQHVTKNNTSSHARECYSTDRKRVDTEEYGRLRAGARKYRR